MVDPVSPGQYIPETEFSLDEDDGGLFADYMNSPGGGPESPGGSPEALYSTETTGGGGGSTGGSTGGSGAFVLSNPTDMSWQGQWTHYLGELEKAKAAGDTAMVTWLQNWLSVAAPAAQGNGVDTSGFQVGAGGGASSPSSQPMTEDLDGDGLPDMTSSSSGETTSGDEGPLDLDEPSYTPPVSLKQVDNGTGPGGPEALPMTDGSGTLGPLPPALERLRPYIEKAAAKFGMPAELLAAQIWQESGGRNKAASSNPQDGGADIGVGQMGIDEFNMIKGKYPDIFGNLQHSDLARSSELGIMATAALMSEYKTKYGSWEAALRGYVSGTGPGFDPSNPQNGSYNPGSDQSYVTTVVGFWNQIKSGDGANLESR
jgi:hypothetical protein